MCVSRIIKPIQRFQAHRLEQMGTLKLAWARILSYEEFEQLQSTSNGLARAYPIKISCLYVQIL